MLPSKPQDLSVKRERFFAGLLTKAAIHGRVSKAQRGTPKASAGRERSGRRTLGVRGLWWRRVPLEIGSFIFARRGSARATPWRGSRCSKNAPDAIVQIIIVIIIIINNNNNGTNRTASVKPELISITAHWVKKGRVRYKLKQRASSVAV